MAKYRLDDILSDLGVPGSDKKAPKEPAPRYRIDEAEDPFARPSTLSPVPLTPIEPDPEPAPGAAAPPPPAPAPPPPPAPSPAAPVAARERPSRAQASDSGSGAKQ